MPQVPIPAPLRSSPGSRSLRPRRYVSLLIRACKALIDDTPSQEFFDVNENSVSYTPVLPSNSQVFIYVSDSNGAEAWSNTVHMLSALRIDIFSEFTNLDSFRSRSAMAIRPASVLLLLTRKHRTTRQLTTRQLRILQLTTRQPRTLRLTTLQLRTPKLTTCQPTTFQMMSRPPTTLRPTMLILRIRVPLRTTPPIQAPLLRPLAPASKWIFNFHARKEFALTRTSQ